MAPKAEQKIYVGIGLDFETGGLDCRECACTQIALQAVRLDTWQTIDSFRHTFRLIVGETRASPVKRSCGQDTNRRGRNRPR